MSWLSSPFFPLSIPLVSCLPYHSSPDTRSRNDEQRCWKGPEWYHRRPENSNGNDDGYRCQMDRDDDGLPFDPRESYRGYSGEAEIHRGRLAKGPKLRQYCRRSIELSPGRRCCDLQEVMVAHCCAGRRPHRRNISDDRDCVDTRHDSSRGKEVTVWHWRTALCHTKDTSI